MGFLSRICPDYIAKFEKIQFRSDKGRDKIASCAIIAEVASSHNNASAAYSGSAGRWRELEAYLTSGGNILIYDIRRTCWQGESDQYSVTVIKSEKELAQYWIDHPGWLTRDLLEGIEKVTSVCVAEEVE